MSSREHEIESSYLLVIEPELDVRLDAALVTTARVVYKRLPVLDPGGHGPGDDVLERLDDGRLTTAVRADYYG